jgi:hypothetical protein
LSRRRRVFEEREEVTSWVRIMPIAALAAETTVEGNNFN